jgi:hypothetical protein
MNQKYPPVKYTEDWQDKLNNIPVQAFFQKEDEPILRMPEGGMGCLFSSLPYHVAVQYGVVELE